MDWSDGYIAVDWGSTNRRAYRLDGEGTCVEGFEDDRGVLAMAGRGFERAVADIRERLGEGPMLLAGMIGSNRGWHEAPYVDCPAGADALVKAILWIEPGRTGLVPGVCQRGSRADVMRGEEVQAIGAASASLVPQDALLCHPGTHSKWIALQGGEIRSFRTLMTGEIYGLLKTRSILADRLQGVVMDDIRFRAAVRAALDGAEPLAELFAIRARALLGEDAHDAASVASGLLIGAELRVALADAADKKVALVGAADLCTLYSAALADAGRQAHVIDGSHAFLAGIAALVEKFR